MKCQTAPIAAQHQSQSQLAQEHTTRRCLAKPSWGFCSIYRIFIQPNWHRDQQSLQLYFLQAAVHSINFIQTEPWLQFSWLLLIFPQGSSGPFQVLRLSRYRWNSLLQIMEIPPLKTPNHLTFSTAGQNRARLFIRGKKILYISTSRKQLIFIKLALPIV